MTADRDSLFAAHALRLGLISSEPLLQAWSNWQGSQLPIGQFLVEQGLLRPDDHARIDHHLDALIAQHSGNPESIWTQLGDAPIRSVLESLSQSRLAQTVEVPIPRSPSSSPSCSNDPDRASDRPIGEMTTAHDSGASNGSRSTGFELTIDSRTPSGPNTASFYEAIDPIVASGEHLSLRYTRTRLHAQGGVGQIWLARDTMLGREVALKELKPEQIDNPLIRDRFVDEARITGQLEHPGIVPIYELARHTVDQRPYYTMKFVRGRTLSRAIREYHERRSTGIPVELEFRSLLDAFVDVCNAVAYAHARGIVHRDLKGQNVMLGDFGEVLVLDWGLAKPFALGAQPPSFDGNSPDPSPGSSPSRNGKDLVDTRPTSGDGPTRSLKLDSFREATLEGQILGTPAYMPPEQAHGRLDDVGPWSDVYSLGAVLYEILTGNWPYSGCNTTAELLKNVRQGKLTPPRQVNPAVPAALEAVCLKAMSYSPSNRYPEASGLAEDVRRWLADEPLSAYPDPWTTRLARWARRHRSAVVAAAAVLALGLPGLALANLLVSQQRDRALALEGIARTAVNDFYLEVADSWLENASDPRQEQYLERALALYQKGPLAEQADPSSSLPTGPTTPGPSGADPPSLEPGQKQAIQAALAYFEHQTESTGRGSSARRDVARTLIRIGDLRRKLGRAADAEDAYRKAIDRLDPIVSSDHASAREQARARARLGSLHAWLGRLETANSELSLAIEELSNLPQLPAESRSISLDLAEAQIELADLQKVLGQSDSALNTFSAAIDRLQPLSKMDPDNAEIARLLAVASDGAAVVQMLGMKPTLAEPLLKQALALLNPLRERFPTVARYREALAKSSNSLGLVLKFQGKPDEAEKALSDALSHYRRLADDFPSRIDYRRALARSLANLAIVHEESGKLRDAETLLSESAKQYEALAQSHPDIPKVRRDLALAQNSLGTILVRRFKDAEAFTAYRRSIEVARELTTSYPDVPDYRNALGSALLNLGIHERIAGTLPASENRLAEAAQIYQELSKSYSDRPDYGVQLGRALDSLGLTLTDLGRPQQAEDAMRRSIAEFDRLLATMPNSYEARVGLASSLMNLATNRPADTDSLQSRALELYKNLLGDRPDSGELKLHLAMSQYNRADRLKASGHPDDAETLLVQAAQSFDDLIPPTEPGQLIQNPTPAAYSAMAYILLGEIRLESRPGEASSALESAVARARQAVQATSGRAHLPTLTHATDLLVQALLNQSRYEDAVRAAISITTAGPSQPQLRVDAARFLTRCITPVSADPSLDPSSRSARSREIADRAIAQLRVAVDAGFRSPDLAGLADFAPLVPRDDFRTIASQAAAIASE